MLKELFIPNAQPRPSVFLTMVAGQVLLLLLLWLFYPLQLFPTLGGAALALLAPTVLCIVMLGVSGRESRTGPLD